MKKLRDKPGTILEYSCFKFYTTVTVSNKFLRMEKRQFNITLVKLSFIFTSLLSNKFVEFVRSVYVLLAQNLQ